MTDIPEIKAELMEPSALESIERAQVDMQISTAKKYPRTLSKVKSDMLSFATLDEETASSCFYTLPRGGKTIQGPSVRMAEIAVSCYGNLRAGARPIHVQASGENPHVIVQAVAHDLERNTLITIEKRRRITKKKSKDTVDEDDINLAVNACASIAFRDAVFKVVPQALIKPVYEEAKKVAIGDATSLAAKRDKVIDRLKQMGATEERILAVIECRKVEDIDADKLGVLIGLGTALKEGEIKLEEAFPAPIAKAEATPATPFKKREQTAGKKEESKDLKPHTATEAAAAQQPASKDPAPGGEGEPPLPKKAQIQILVDEADINPVRLESFLRKKGILSPVASLASMSEAVAGDILTHWNTLADEFAAQEAR